MSNKEDKNISIFIVSYRVFHICWNKSVASQTFPVDFILFLFSYYYWEIVNILIYLTRYTRNDKSDDRAKDLLYENILQN